MRQIFDLVLFLCFSILRYMYFSTPRHDAVPNQIISRLEVDFFLFATKGYLQVVMRKMVNCSYCTGAINFLLIFLPIFLSCLTSANQYEWRDIPPSCLILNVSMLRFNYKLFWPWRKKYCFEFGIILWKINTCKIFSCSWPIFLKRQYR